MVITTSNKVYYPYLFNPENMRLLFILLFLTLSVSANAQKTEFTKPDYQQIKKDIEDASSPLYYPTLLSRLASYDTTLTTKEYTWLYYGYFFHKDYEPYWRFDDEDELIKYYRKEKLEEKRLRQNNQTGF